MRFLGINFGSSNQEPNAIRADGENAGLAHNILHKYDIPHHHHAKAEPDGSGTEVIGIIGNPYDAAEVIKAENLDDLTVQTHKMSKWETKNTENRHEIHKLEEKYSDDPLSDPMLGFF